MSEWRALMLQAYDRFHACEGKPDLAPLTSYDMVHAADAANGTFAWWWGAAGELRETINSANAWGVRLREWDVWNCVIQSFADETQRWEILYHFMEPIAYFCMHQPSSFKDRLITAVEGVLHQANRRGFPDEPDRLDQDNLPPGHVLRRQKRIAQLGRLGARWSTYEAFRDALVVLDDAAYRKLSRDFRNLSAHAFAPRLLIGHTPRAIRTVVSKTELVSQPDGTYLEVQHPTQTCVSYAMAEVQPFDPEEAHKVNLAEYHKARDAISRLGALVAELCEEMNSDAGSGAPITTT